MNKNNSNRFKYLASIVAETFNVFDGEAMEIFQGYKYADAWENWMQGKGSAHMFIYYQKPGKFNQEAGEWEEAKSAQKEFQVSEGEAKIKGKGIFFLRLTPPGKAINGNQTSDNEVLIGEVHENTHNVLNTIITNVYNRFLDKLEANDWGECESDAKKEYQATYSKFSEEVKEAIKSLQQPLNLAGYDTKYQADANSYIQNPAKQATSHKNMVDSFEQVFIQWYEQIEKSLDDSEEAKKDVGESGPKVELDFWKNKMRKLTGISEQLKSKNCRTVYDVLNLASGGNASDSGKPKEKLYLATSKWRSIELKVTEQLNEAKDNVKYLQTLEKFIEPLYDGNPTTIIDTLPALMNSIKMIHTIARYYNTNERMTGLFIKITNMMIHNCKYHIINFRRIRMGLKPEGKLGGLSDKDPRSLATPLDDQALWKEEEFPHEELIEMLATCEKLLKEYKSNYEKTRDRLKEMPKAKQFDFSEQVIFAKFELFARRVGKLKELFRTIKQFKELEKHNLEDIQSIVDKFSSTVKEFKNKNHKLLDYMDGVFDKDYVEFNVEVSHVEIELKRYIDRQFDHVTNIEDSLKLLRKFRFILKRPMLEKALYEKYELLLKNYSKILEKIEKSYTDHSKNPPIVRNLPTVAGCITWSRHLIHRAMVPLQHFPKDILMPQGKHIKQYTTASKISITLYSFELAWRTKWSCEVDKAKAGLLATLLVTNPSPEDSKKSLFVNFDSDILTLIREAKCLSRLGADIPNQAKIVLLQEEKFKMYKNELQFIIKEYNRIHGKIRPNVEMLLSPHKEDLQHTLRPGFCNLTWTSMNIDGYLNHVHIGLERFDQLIININDIMDNRIQNNLDSLSKTVLVNLPVEDKTYSLEDFVHMQEQHISTQSDTLKSKNFEVEDAVIDLINTINNYKMNQQIQEVAQEEIQKINRYYNWSMYQALLHATKFSLNQMKERICGRRNAPKQVLKPFFEVDVHLEGSQSILKPTLEEVQSAINRAASHVLKSTKNVQNWNQGHLSEDQREPFYDWIAKDKEIVKVILLLTGSIQGTKNKVTEFLARFENYQWLWREKPEDSLKKFKQQDPGLEQFETKLSKFDDQMREIAAIDENHQIGALSLKTKNVKRALTSQINNWKDVFSMELHKKAKMQLDELFDEIKAISTKIDKPVGATDVDSLGGVMSAMEEIRKKQSDIKHQFRPIKDMYELLELQNPGESTLEKDENENLKKLMNNWDSLVIKSEKIRNSLHKEQAEYKKVLIENIGRFTEDVIKFHEDFEEKGPNQAAKNPKEAVNRLKMFTEEFQVRKRKYDSYFKGEVLFGLPHQDYPNLTKVEQELIRLEKLYGLYQRVNNTIEEWKEYPWENVNGHYQEMTDQVEKFESECRKLPQKLKDQPAYTDLKKEITDMQELLPLIQGLARDCVKDRHWEEIMEQPGYAPLESGYKIPYDQESFVMKNILEANLLTIRDEVEDISDQAEKQERLERGLREIDSCWALRDLDIGGMVGSTNVNCVIQGNIIETQEKLEEHTMQLQQYNAFRYVKPFQDEVTSKILLLSETSDLIEKWLKVQLSWQNLVQVFTSGDIAKAMPQESKIFKNVDKKWIKIMDTAAERKNVVQCCQNDILKNELPQLKADLDLCQKKLDTYLNSKRNIFPRFFFCSDKTLLTILSNGSDPTAIQDYFENLFDAINKVTFDEYNPKIIKTIIQTFAGAEEELAFVEGVLAEGNVEEWLGKVEKEMQNSVKGRAISAASDCMSMKFEDFVPMYQSQFALLGVQLLWTQKTTEALQTKQKDRRAAFKTKLKELEEIMDILQKMCLSDIKSKLIRIKIETLVTIHVHQVQLYKEIQEKSNGQILKDESDFDWQMNMRVYKDQEKQDIKVCITDVSLFYQYEFLGVKERLCVTPLTDRCYITLAQALGMNYGGAPAGPAGTGKTETVKDLGRSLGIFVVVTNCSPEHKMIDMAKIFKGLCMSGLWGCFDEFNRISLPTLSVVAAQVEAMTTAKKKKQSNFLFPGEDKNIKMNAACGYFITMNPGYAGRQSLPENLKVLFRGVTMMVPDRQIIIEVKLASVGYLHYTGLSLKFNTLYKLSEEQLSAQRHYDFGLRNILSVLRTAGMLKRDEAVGTDEYYLVARTLNDMNMSKFVFADKALFQGLIEDIFTKFEAKKRKIYEAQEKELKREFIDRNLLMNDSFFIKMIQLFETSRVRHGFMVVGAAGCGKTTIYNVLTSALSQVQENGEKIAYEITRFNPKALTGIQLYGYSNNAGEWEDGIFANVWKKLNNKKVGKKWNWIQADGPVDAIWIENLNTVLDDNKILTLANAERIAMSDFCKMTFEVENLMNASPATVSRCGIVYVSPNELGWEPLLTTWALDKSGEGKNNQAGIKNWTWMFANCKKRSDDPTGKNWNILAQLCKKYLQAHEGNANKRNTFEWCEKNLVYKMHTPEVVRITMFLNLLEAVIDDLMGGQDKTVDFHLSEKEFERLFIYAFAWAMAGLCEVKDRQLFDKEILQHFKAPTPSYQLSKTGEQETIFEYYVDPITKEWRKWEAVKWDAPKKLIFSQLLIPTMDSTRAEFILAKVAALPESKSTARNEKGITSTLIVGGPGTAKTSCILMYSEKIKEKQAFKRINFSNATTPFNFQESIDGEVVKKNSRTYFPEGNKIMTVFIDDFSMPKVNEWGDQETLEITRQLMDQKGLYFLDKEERGNFKNIINLKFLAAMNHPGGGFNDVPNRIKRQFFSFNMTEPSDKSVVNIFGAILNALCKKGYSADVVQMLDPLIEATIAVWRTTSGKLLKTPSKFHYSFNIRELSRVFQGIASILASPEYEVVKKVKNRKDKPSPAMFMVGLWRHECMRTFCDKLINSSDKKTFTQILDKTTKEKFNEMELIVNDPNYDEDMLLTDYLFANFQRDETINEETGEEEPAPYVYEACSDLEQIRNRCYEKLEKFNERYPVKKMSLVLFEDALCHLLRITRILGTPAGSILLVGVGGSGKQSLTRLASYIEDCAYSQIKLNKSYGLKDFMEHIRELYDKSTGMQAGVSFILTDAEIKSETFLEAINSMLATGEIPGLLGKEERDLFPAKVKIVYQKLEKKKDDPPSAWLWQYFLKRVRDNLHMVLAFSPVGSKFRERAQKFPSLFSQCSIDWFLQWPLEALVDVSKKKISDFSITCTKDTKAQLIEHMGQVHNMVTEVCDLYFSQFRRRVYVTPKSYLSFLEFYQKLYKQKVEGINVEEKQIIDGLYKLEDASSGVAIMKKELAVKEELVRKTSESVNELLKTLEKENEKADKKAKEVGLQTDNIAQMKRETEEQRAVAEKELEQALPFQRAAVKAADGIEQKDISEVKTNRNPKSIMKLVFDCILIVFQKPIDPITMMDHEINREQVQFFKDSWDNSGKELPTPTFLKALTEFTDQEKDIINDETVELLEPYLELKFPKAGTQVLNPEIAGKASKALMGLTQWCEAMSMYQKASKIVKPKMLQLQKAQADLQEADSQLERSQKALEEVENLRRQLKAQFEKALGEKEDLENEAKATRKKSDQASRLINSLGDNKVRWEESKRSFTHQKNELVGNVAKASAFVCYCGPFNTEFRNKLTGEYFQTDLDKRHIPSAAKLKLTDFLVDQTQCGEWQMEGLPQDDLSIQNAIMVTKSDRYPLMIDPQGQARKWILKREEGITKHKTLFTLAHKDLKQAISTPLEEGYPAMIENIENEVDPMLDPLLEKAFVTKGRKKKVNISDSEIEVNDNFTLFMTSRMANPLFSPELAAKTTIIDFTVTQGGLEQQLLGILIGQIEKQLEDQLTNLQEEVTRNKKELKVGEEQLLHKLATAEGSLLDDPTLIDVLAEIKTKSKEVTENLENAVIKTEEINDKREKYRPVAARGAVLYFCIVEMTMVNWMYNTSLYQFLELFDWGIENAPKAPRVEDRVANIISTLTYKVYRYINRGLFEADKITFKMMVCLKIMIQKKEITSNDVNVFLKSGSGVTGESLKYSWMELKTQNNIKSLSQHRFEGENQPFFKDIFERINRFDKEWKAFIENSEPESAIVPEYDDKIRQNALGHFIHLCLIRALREDRTVLASRAFIERVLSAEYTRPINDKIEDLFEESTPEKPVLYLLQAGADPTQTVDEFALKKKKPAINKVSMGEAQEIPAKEKILEGHQTGRWLLLSNCQLSLDLMSEMETLLRPTDHDVDPNFRLWITCEADNDFPLGLLQMAIKNSFVPPKGLQAGLSRTFNTQVSTDFLERVEPVDKWVNVVFATCFMHSIVLERRKFGALGFTVPYEFNYGDMEASLLFMEKHMTHCWTNNLKESWKAINYITCHIQYGGRITDNMDREMFSTYGELWLTDKLFEKGYNFNALSEWAYKIPETQEHNKILEYINTMPEKDSPVIFGLNNSADLTFRLNESTALITTLVDVQPREAGGSGGLSREDQVKQKIETEFLKNLPANFDRIDCEKQILAFRAPQGLQQPKDGRDKQLPLSVFLRQELDTMQRILDISRTMMQEMVRAIDGEVVMTPDLVTAIDMVYVNRVPRQWTHDPTGAEISWISANLGSWFTSMHARYRQLKLWLEKDSPSSYWLTGFVRPQAFLTAVKQTVARQQRVSAGQDQEAWALDNVVYSTTVQKDEIKSADGSLEGKSIKAPAQGVFIHGLYMEGAQWNKQGQHLEDSEAKDLRTMFKDFPMMLVTAVSTKKDDSENRPNQGKKGESLDQLARTHYYCPVYRYKARTDKYLIFRCYLKPEGSDAQQSANKMKPTINWKLKGVALLCQKD